MTRISALSVKAPNRSENEDRVIHAGTLLGVLDGVTAPPDLDSGCIHSVAWYVDHLADHLAKQSTSQDPLPDLLAHAIQAVSEDHGPACDLASPYTPAASLCLTRNRPDHVEYLILSDCTLIADTGTITVLTDTRLVTSLAEILRVATADDVVVGSPEDRQRQHAATLQKHELTNQPHGYWIAASNPNAAHNAVTGTLPRTGLTPVRRFALLTDGVTRAVDILHLTTWQGLLDTLSTDGPQQLIGQLRQAEYADTQTRPRYKPHDDASVIFCSFEEDQ